MSANNAVMVTNGIIGMAQGVMHSLYFWIVHVLLTCRMASTNATSIQVVFDAKLASFRVLI